MRLFLFSIFFKGALGAALDPNVALTTHRLRVYCNACHGLGELRFITTEDDEAFWNFLHREKAPNSKKVWADAIIDVLNWPSDEPPPFNQLLQPPEKDWMPKGAKRLRLAEDWVNGVPVRRILLETLLAGGAGLSGE